MNELTTRRLAFTKDNRATLWALRAYHGHLRHTFRNVLGGSTLITAEHADRLIDAGRSVDVEVPDDPNCPVRI